MSDLLGFGDEGDDDRVQPTARAGEGAGPTASSAGALVSLPIRSIGPNPLQPRSHFEREELEGLAASIRELGVLQPVLVREVSHGRYELIAGERRWRAAGEAGLTEVPAIIRTVDDLSMLEQAVVENLHRSDLNGVEEAAAYRQLMDEFGLTQDEVARRVGKSRSAVANTLRLLQLAPTVQRLVMVGELSAGHARALLTLSDPIRQSELARTVVTDELSVREVEELVRRQGRTAGSARRENQERPTGDQNRPASILEIEQLLGDRLATRVSVSLTRNRGRLVVEFADMEDLDRIFRELDSSSGGPGDSDLPGLDDEW